MKEKECTQRTDDQQKARKEANMEKEEGTLKEFTQKQITEPTCK